MKKDGTRTGKSLVHCPSGKCMSTSRGALRRPRWRVGPRARQAYPCRGHANAFYSRARRFPPFSGLGLRARGTRGPSVRTGVRILPRLAADGTGYADVIINPTHWNGWHRQDQRHDRCPRRRLQLRRTGRTAAVELCISLLRTQTADEAAELVDRLIEWRHPRVVALSDRRKRGRCRTDRPRFTEAFRRARAAGLRRTRSCRRIERAERRA